MNKVVDLVEKLRDAASQAGHYGAWSGGVLLQQAADEIDRLREENKPLKQKANALADTVHALLYRRSNRRAACGTSG